MNACDWILYVAYMTVVCVYFMNRTQLWNQSSPMLLDAPDNRLHFVILGSDQLAEQLEREMQVRYQLKLSWEQNSSDEIRRLMH